MTIECAVLGATGTVGQKAIALLQQHPYLQLKDIIASQKNRGKRIQEVTHWREKAPISKEFDSMKLKGVDEISAPVVISALPADEALEIEPMLAQKGIHVFSNASAFRMVEPIPLMIPEINGHLVSRLDEQKTPGKIITNPNCSTVFITLAMAPLIQKYKLDHCHIMTMQAISGAGHPGIPSMDILGDIVPYIKNEEEKIELETRKILKDLAPHDYSLQVNVNRVPVLHGHTVILHLHFRESLSPQQVKLCYEDWNSKHQNLYKLYQQVDRPRPNLDLQDHDQNVHIGRIRQGGRKNIISLVALGHNLVRGAAGAAIKNLEHSISTLF